MLIFTWISTILLTTVISEVSALSHESCNGMINKNNNSSGNLFIMSKKTNCTWTLAPPSGDINQVLMVTVIMATGHTHSDCEKAVNYIVEPGGPKLCLELKSFCQVYYSPLVSTSTDTLNTTNEDDDRLQRCNRTWTRAEKWPPKVSVVNHLGSAFKVNLTYTFIRVRRDFLRSADDDDVTTTGETIILSSTLESTSGGGGGGGGSGSSALTLALQTVQYATPSSAAASGITLYSQHATSSFTTGNDMRREKSTLWIVFLSLALVLMVGLIGFLVYRFRVRRRKNSEIKDDINPYAVHITSREGADSLNGYSNVQFLERPYDVIDIDGTRQCKQNRRRNNDYLEPIPGQFSPYCEITAENLSDETRQRSFGRTEFFLYDVANNVTNDTDSPPDGVTQQHYVMAEDPDQDKATTLPYPGNLVGGNDNVQYSEIIVPRDEEDEYKQASQSPTFDVNNHVTVQGTTASPYGEIIGEINATDGRLRRFTESEATYKSVKKKNSAE